MIIKHTRRSTDSHTLFDAVEANTLTLLRNHVRAIDNSDDDLLKVYLDAAIDYMQTLTNRLLGSHDVTILIDKDESSRLLSAPIDNVTSLGGLYYLSKDPDDVSPFALTYSVISEEAQHTGNSYIFGNDADWNNGKEYTISESLHDVNVVLTYNVSAIGQDLGDGTIDQVRFIPQTQGRDGAYTNGIQTSSGVSVNLKTITSNGTETHVFGRLPAGKYRVQAQAMSGTGQGATYIGPTREKYFIVNDGFDFDNHIDTDAYPIHLDLSNGLSHDQVSSNGTDYNTNFWKMTLVAGLPLASLPAQYKQAALLLIGHYYNMREAEAIGGITMELKEGVQRLMSSARLY